MINFQCRNPWIALVEGGEGSYLPNCQTNLVIALYRTQTQQLTTWAPRAIIYDKKCFAVLIPGSR